MWAVTPANAPTMGAMSSSFHSLNSADQQRGAQAVCSFHSRTASKYSPAKRRSRIRHELRILESTVGQALANLLR